MNEHDERYKEARSRVNELRSFYRNLLTYLMINVVIVIINLVTSPDRLWFYWVTITLCRYFLEKAVCWAGNGKRSRSKR